MMIPYSFRATSHLTVTVVFQVLWCDVGACGLTKGRPVKGYDSAASSIGKGLHDVAPGKGATTKAMHQQYSSLIWTSSLHTHTQQL